MTTTGLHGIHVPLITPFTASGDIATDSLEALAHGVLDDGATGIVALGTTAEASSLDTAEKHLVVDVCARVCRERGATLTVGAGGNGTRTVAQILTALPHWPEAGYAMVTVPYFTRPARAGVIAHFTELARISPLPIVAYHVPYRTAQPLDTAGLHEIARIPGIAGMKYAAGGIDADTMTFLADLPDGFTVLGGDDAVVSPLFALGAPGAILASAHLTTRAYADLLHAWQTGNLDRARSLGSGLARLAVAAFAEPNPTVIKAVLHAQGRIPNPGVRLPLVPASAPTVDDVLKLLADTGQLG